jgi:DNA-binding HxlR family transcriptional regulator
VQVDGCDETSDPDRLADLSALPLLRPVLIDLFEELPSSSTGLGATDMRMLELIARGYSLTNALFHLRQLRQTRIFSEWEYGYLLDGLAHGPRPAVKGLDEELRTLSRENLRDRHAAYLRSELSLTEFGKAVLAHKEDFSRHNPIDRWWGGTHLTNDRLWRWNPALVKP